MSVSTGENGYLYISLIGFVGVFTCIGIALYLAYNRVELMLSHLKNCPTITIRAFLLHAGPWGRLHLLGAIMGLMTMPRVHLRDGGASAEDLKNFPADLRLQLVMLHWTSGFLLLVMIGMGIVAKLGLV